MSLTINSNLEAMNASRNLNNTENMLAQSMQRLSSGLKINSASDDVAGYAISESLQSQVNGLNQASENIQDAVALAQTAQGALNDVNQMLQRIRELAVQYSNGTTSTEDQNAIISEVGQLVDEIKRVGQTTQFNGKNLLDEDEEIRFQVGANDGEGVSVTTVKLYASIEAYINVSSLGARLTGEGKELEAAEETEVETLEEEIVTLREGAGAGGEGLIGKEEELKVAEAEAKKTAAENTETESVKGTEVEEAVEAEVKEINEVKREIVEKEKEVNAILAKAEPTGLKEISEAIAKVSGLAGEFGAVQDRIQYTQSNLEVYSQNLTSAVSALVDVNMATEMTNFTKDQVLQQAGVSILAQANQLPDATLKLLEG